MALDYWYDAQLRRYWLQFCRIFENFTYMEGVGESGVPTFRAFPIRLAGKDKQVGVILRNNSENTILSCPRLSAEMTDLQMDDDRRQNPSHVSTVNVVERAIDPVTQRYTGERGNTYSVERFMGVPFKMEMKLSIWTSNEHQKHQFMEQVLMLFNPAIDLQSSDNPLDPGALTIVKLTGINWSDRSFPITDDDIEISSLTFEMPVWIQPPAKVKRQNIIHQIITNIATVQPGNDIKLGDGVNFSASDYHTRIIVTPGDHQINVAASNGGYLVTLLDAFGQVDPTFKWLDLLNQYGAYRPGISQLRLKTNDDMSDHDSDIIGTYAIHPEPQHANQLVWNPDLLTMPADTLPPVDAMINLHGSTAGIDYSLPTSPEVAPGLGGLPEAAVGQRYLLAEDLIRSDAYWPFNLGADPSKVPEDKIMARMNDIIEFDGTYWSVRHNAMMTPTVEYVTNIRSGKQLKWTGDMWIMAIDGDYRPGAWRIFL
jgi:hypothetical protein